MSKTADKHRTIKRFEYIAPSKLNPYDGNPRRNDHVIQELVKSLEHFGFVAPIIAGDKDNMIVAGHTRWKAAIKSNLKEVPVCFVDLSDTDSKLYNLADNKLAEKAEWDLPILADIVSELQELDVDVELSGFNEAEIDELIESTKPEYEGQCDEDAVPDVPDEPVTKTGDLWVLGRHRLLCGDATKKTDVGRLMEGKKADMVFTDPPYGIDYQGGRKKVTQKKGYGKIMGDKDKDISKYVDAIISNNYKRDCYICLSPVNLKSAFKIIENYDGIIVWKKPAPGMGYQFIRRYCEFIIFISKRKKAKIEASEFDYWKISTDKKIDYEHGNQKPVELSQRAIMFSSVADDLISDWFLGSGSTLIACEKTNRICYGMELDPYYCDVIVQRWENYTGEKAKLVG